MLKVIKLICLLIFLCINEVTGMAFHLSVCYDQIVFNCKVVSYTNNNTNTTF